MGAVGLDQTDAAAEVAEGNQLFAENVQPDGHVGKLIGVADRLPEPAQVLASRGAGPMRVNSASSLGTCEW